MPLPLLVFPLGVLLSLGASTPTFAAKTSQTITFAQPPDRIFGAAPFTVAVSASSGLPVSLASTTSGVCRTTGSTVTLVAAGNCTLAATQAGNATYAAAPKVNRTFAVAKASQTIAFAAIGDKVVGSPPFVAEVTATSGLAVKLTSTTTKVCTVGGSKVTPKAIGTCTLRATQGGNGNYNAAADVSRSFAVVSASKLSQTITFAAIGDQWLGAAPFAVTATASSGLPVSLASLTSGVCGVSGNAVTLVASGTCSLRAAQPGDTVYAAAPSVDRSFGVSATGSIQMIYDGAGNAIRVQRHAAH